MPFMSQGDFARPVLDALPQHIAVIDASGAILWTNDAWRSFGQANGGHRAEVCEPANYFDACRRSETGGEGEAGEALRLIRAVVEGEEPAAYLEYACHSPEAQRWFVMRCCRIGGAPGLFVVTHENITERKLAEMQVERLAMVDGLTGVANRRRFDEALEGEWRRARRAGGYVSLVLLDVDDFKSFNDRQGHLAGDDCLREVARALAPLGRRAGDLVARYGGEEFAIVLGATDLSGAVTVAEAARRGVEGLGAPGTPDAAAITVSAGVATFRLTPDTTATPRDLQKAADDALYAAKRAGRNRVEAGAVRIGAGGVPEGNRAETGLTKA